MAARRPTPPRTRRPQAAATPVPAAGAGAPREGLDQFTVCTRLCGGRCCRYVTVAFPAPRSVDDWDEVRWWLAHQDTMVTEDHDGWMLHVKTPCTHLRPDNGCGVYPDRMLACEYHDATDCEFTGDVPFDVVLRSEADLADHLVKRRLKRARPVLAAIRRAQAARAQAVPAAPAGTLVPLRGLTS